MSSETEGGCCLIYCIVFLCMIVFGGLSKCSCSHTPQSQPKNFDHPIETDNPELKCSYCGGRGMRWVNHVITLVDIALHAINVMAPASKIIEL